MGLCEFAVHRLLLLPLDPCCCGYHLGSARPANARSGCPVQCLGQPGCHEFEPAANDTRGWQGLCPAPLTTPAVFAVLEARAFVLFLSAIWEVKFEASIATQEGTIPQCMDVTVAWQLRKPSLYIASVWWAVEGAAGAASQSGEVRGRRTVASSARAIAMPGRRITVKIMQRVGLLQSGSIPNIGRIRYATTAGTTMANLQCAFPSPVGSGHHHSTIQQ